MLNFKEVEVTCDYCYGSGEKNATREDLKNYLWNMYFDYKKIKPCPGAFKNAMKEYRKWQENQTLPCKYCDGQGKWTERW